MPYAARHRLWHVVLPLLLALALIAGWAAPAAMQGPPPTPPQANELCGHPRFEPKAARLERTLTWRPLPRETLGAEGRLDAQGALVPDHLGQQRTFWAASFEWDPIRYYPLTATCVRVGVHAYLYLESGQTVDADVLDRLSAEFDNTIYAKDTAVFGSEPRPGVDGDERIYLLLLDIRDGWNGTTRTSYYAGYFDSTNEYLNSDLPAAERFSNEKEILYVDLNPARLGSTDSLGTVAHEFQHMIHWWMDGGHDEETWVNEGCACLAQYLCGYGIKRSHLLTENPANPGFLEEPDHQLTLTGAAWESASNHILASYGASFMWTLYFWEQCGSDGAIRRLVAEPANGIQGVDNTLAALGSGDRFAQVFRRWVTANYLGDGGGPFGYRSLQLVGGAYNGTTTFPRPRPALTHLSYPVNWGSGTVSSWAGCAIRLPGFAGAALNLGFSGAGDNRFAVTVVRSSTYDLAPGTNLVSEINLDGTGDGLTRLLSLPGETGAVLLIPAGLSGSSGHSYTYSAALWEAPDLSHGAFLPIAQRSVALEPTATATPRPTLTPTATPSPGPRPGYWNDGNKYADFYVTPDGAHVRGYRLWVTILGCGLHVISIDQDIAISGDRFSYYWSNGTSQVSILGVFNSPTSASLSNQVTNYPFTGCGYRSSGRLYSTATWQGAAAPPRSSEGAVQEKLGSQSENGHGGQDQQDLQD